MYNGHGLRSSRTRAGQVRNFHHDHLQRLLFETDGSGAVTAYYFYNGRQLVAVQRAGAKVFFHHFDHNGNTVALTDASGALVATYRYSPYGQILSQTGAVENPFTYVGAYGVMDDGDGIYLMRHRYYDALTGRFLKKDTIGIAGGLNLYEYAKGNPLLNIDPEGTAVFTTLLVVGAGLAVGHGLYTWATTSKCPNAEPTLTPYTPKPGHYPDSKWEEGWGIFTGQKMDVEFRIKMNEHMRIQLDKKLAWENRPWHQKVRDFWQGETGPLLYEIPGFLTP